MKHFEMELYKYYTMSNNRQNVDNSIVSMFDGRLYHCGLADRLRGITSIYHFCKLKSRQYKIHFIHPFRLEKYLVPNNYNWIIEPNNLIYDLQVSQPVLLYCDGRDDEIRKHRDYLDTCCYPNKQIHIYTNTLCYDSFYHKEFHELFSISPHLKSILAPHLHELRNGYISASFRFCNLLGDFKDILNPLPDSEQAKLIQDMLDFLYSLEKKQYASKILVTSDSLKFIEKAKNLTSVYTVPGTIKHLNNAFSTEQIDKTFIDFFLISMANIAFCGYTKQMYRGAFAERAALTGNVPFFPILIDSSFASS